jgi:hypothetical protein
MDGEKRRRLKKLKQEPSLQSSNGLIPKKKNFSQSEKTITQKSDDDDSIENFISDRIEYDRNGPPISSEESAHSTDEEHYIRKRKKIKNSDDESSASEESEDIVKNEDLDFSEEEEEEEGEPKIVLVGKQALEEKRKQGLIPGTKKVGAEATESKKKNKKKHEEVELKKKNTFKKKNKDPKKYIQFSEFNEKDRKKAEMVTKILQRWWYSIDDWPPEGYNYSEVLLDKGLRVVSKENWSVEPSVNEQGLAKVMQLPGYTGVFVDQFGNAKDLRPTSSCPSFDNIFNKPLQEIKEILIKALSNQIEQLKSQLKPDKDLMKELTKELAYYQKQL